MVVLLQIPEAYLNQQKVVMPPIVFTPRPMARGVLLSPLRPSVPLPICLFVHTSMGWVGTLSGPFVRKYP